VSRGHRRFTDDLALTELAAGRKREAQDPDDGDRDRHVPEEMHGEAEPEQQDRHANNRIANMAVSCHR